VEGLATLELEMTMHDTQNGDVRRVFASAEFFATVEREYPRFFEVAQRVLTAMHSVADRAYENPEPYQRAILNLSMVSGVSFVEVITLVGNGLGHGAMRILRSLMETAINIEFFRLRPDAFEDYREWYHIERFKEFEFVRQHAANVFAALDSQVVADAEREMTRVRPRFEQTRHDGTARLRGSWSSLDLGARAIVTGFEESYRLINPMASSFVHDTMYGMLRHFDAARDENRIEVPPTLKWSTEALSGAHNLMVRVVTTLSGTFAVASEPTVEVLEREWRYAWTEPRPVS
jgi:uncharacterized protein DUF5677